MYFLQWGDVKVRFLVRAGQSRVVWLGFRQLQQRSLLTCGRVFKETRYGELPSDLKWREAASSVRATATKRQAPFSSVVIHNPPFCGDVYL
jgi:hypothetical protein